MKDEREKAITALHRSAAHRAAVRRLVDRHRKEFKRLYNEEKAARGL